MTTESIHASFCYDVWCSLSPLSLMYSDCVVYVLLNYSWPNLSIFVNIVPGKQELGVKSYGVNGRYFALCLSTVEIVLPCPHWFLFYSLTSVIPVDKISIASSNSPRNSGWKMRVLWNDLVSWCSFPVWWRWSLSKAIQCGQSAGRKKAFCSWHWGPCANITSITTKKKQRDRPLQSGNLLAVCYHGISFHKASLSGCAVGNWWCQWGLIAQAPFVFSLTFPFWPLGGSRNMPHRQVSKALVLIQHSGQAGLQAARLIMIDSEITELILE